MIVMIDGVERELTPGEEAAFLASLPPSAPPVPVAISRRQFFQQAAVGGLVAEEEALAAVRTGATPAALQAIVDGLPEEERFGAEMLISGATTFERAHPLTAIISSSLGVDADAFFIAAGAL